MVIELTMAMAEICLMVYLYKSGYKQYTYIYMLISLPVLFFCINMLDEAVTVDEMQYMKAFIDISGMQQGSYIWNKATYQYRLTQMVMGTIFRIQNWIYPGLTDNVSLIIYKMIHWLMYYLVALFTAFVWGSKILSIDKDSQRYRISNICILYVLIGMPISCLIMKVCNYDAGNVYFAIAGFSLAIAAEKQKNPRLAFWGAVVAVFGCMEKWGCLIYWCICVSFYAFLKIREKRELKKRIFECIKAVITAFLLAVCICWISLFYVRILEGKGLNEISVGTALFPLFFMIRAFRYQSKIVDFSDLSVYNESALKYLILVMFLIILLSTVLYIMEKPMNIMLRRKYTVFQIVNSIVWIAIILAAVIGAYTVIQYEFPVVDIKKGMYMPKASMSGVTFFYGARSLPGHIVLQNIYAFSTIFASMPTVALIILFFAMIFQMKAGLGNQYVFNSLLAFSFIAPVIFTISGQPATARYYGVPIILVVIFAIYIVAESQIKIFNSKVLLGGCYILYAIEMFLNVPNFHCYCPFWIIHPKEYRENVIAGVYRAGQAITWGENVAIGCNLITDIVDEEILKYEDITVYSDYSYHWLANPGFAIKSISGDPDADGMEFSRYEFYIMARVNLTHHEVPEYMLNIEPVASYKYNGETSIWIYRGDQLAPYKELF